MCGDCENCEVLVKSEQDRIEWAKDLTLKNIELHKQVTEQQDLITTLKMKLMEKRVSAISDYIRSRSDPAVASDDERRDEGEDEEDYFDASPTVSQEALQQKMHEINSILEMMNTEKENFLRDMEQHSRYFAGIISFLNGQVKHFRESLFTEMRKSNELKALYNQKIKGICNRSNEAITSLLQEELVKVGDAFKSKYKDVIEKRKEEIERQTKLVAKLRKHNKQLYLHIQKIKNENATRVVYLEKTVQELKKTAKKLREKNENLHKQIKLEVEGCQNDIQDARKKIGKLTNPQN